MAPESGVGSRTRVRLLDHPAAALLDASLPDEVREGIVVAIVRAAFPRRRGGGEAAARALGLSEATMYRHLAWYRHWSRKTILRVYTLNSTPSAPSHIDESPSPAVQ